MKKENGILLWIRDDPHVTFETFLFIFSVLFTFLAKSEMLLEELNWIECEEKQSFLVRSLLFFFVTLICLFFCRVIIYHHFIVTIHKKIF